MILVSLPPAETAGAEPQHAIAMHGEPFLNRDFPALPYVNSEAPQAGRLTMGEVGSYDSLNPYVLKGRAPWQIRALTVESLMARSWDEPFTLYGLLAETIEVPEDRSWVAFTLREGASFSDGSKVTAEDVVWSIETLGTSGHPRYRTAWRSVASIEATSPRRVVITFAEPNRELPLIMGLRPILKKAQWQGRTFAERAADEVVGSGPYIIGEADFGRRLILRRDPNWWGADLPVNRGLYNFDTVRIEYFRNEDAYLEAVRTAAIDLHAEYDPVRWTEGYDIPAMADGRLTRSTLSHQRPSGLHGFVFNTRREIFADRRVREALAISFDWDWVNQRLYRGSYTRIESAFGQSPLGFEGPAAPSERAILEAFDLPHGTLESGWRPPASDGSGRDRRALRSAGRLLDEAGWPVSEGQRRRGDKTFSFEILVSGAEQETLASLWSAQLKRLGVTARVRRVDTVQYQQRRETYDYDMIVNRWG
ncbi:MAG: extracellular solute-binding protein, partial [Pseudomonadota bacterium]